MKYVLGILLATVLLPKLATGNGSGLLAFYLNHESTEAFRQAAPFFAGAAGLFTFILVIWSRTRPNAPIRAGAIKPPAIIIYTFIAAAAAWMITAKSAPVVLSAFGSPATSQTVLVMKAVGNVP